MKTSNIISNVTGGRCDITELRGSHCKHNRHVILQTLSDVSLKKSECGYNAMRAALLAKFDIPAACIAIENQNLQAAILADSQS